MGKFKNENDDFKDYMNSGGEMYQKEIILFKGSEFGESFVFSALLYRYEELYLDPSYTENGNFIISGPHDINQRCYSELSESKMLGRNKQYKAAIYWVNSNHKIYLFGFHQKGKLVLIRQRVFW